MMAILQKDISYTVATGSQAKMFHAFIICPKCGKGGSIARATHEAASGGRVSPSMVCPHEGCGFHGSVVLERWGT